MSRIRVVEPDKAKWSLAREITPPALFDRFSELELDAGVRFREKGSDNSLQLFEVRYLPDTEVHVHAHDADEIIYILGGEMHVGNRVLGPGASMFVAGNTLYGFKAGPQGLHFLNFRPRIDLTFVTPKEFQERRAAPAGN